jgi:hypothetical protein
MRRPRLAFSIDDSVRASESLTRRFAAATRGGVPGARVRRSIGRDYVSPRVPRQGHGTRPDTRFRSSPVTAGQRSLNIGRRRAAVSRADLHLLAARGRGGATRSPCQVLRQCEGVDHHSGRKGTGGARRALPANACRRPTCAFATATASSSSSRATGIRATRTGASRDRRPDCDCGRDRGQRCVARAGLTAESAHRPPTADVSFGAMWLVS